MTEEPMNEQERTRTYYKALEIWGKDTQVEMTIEKMAELTFALQKLKRLLNIDGVTTNIPITKAIQNVQEEVSDVWIMMNQLKIIFGIEDINKIIRNKLRRLLNRIENKPDNYNPNQTEIKF